MNPVSFSDKYRSPTPEQINASTTIQRYFRGHVVRNNIAPRHEVVAQASNMRAISGNQIALRKTSSPTLAPAHFNIIPKDRESAYINLAVQLDSLSVQEPYSKEDIKFFLQREDSWLGFAMNEDGQAIGYVISSADPDFDMSQRLVSVVVLPQNRGNGVGKACVQSFLQDAMSRGRSYAELRVEESNITAKSIYAKFGFSQFCDDHELLIKVLNPLLY